MVDMTPRGSQDRPKNPQDSPTTTQNSPKTVPRRPKSDPRRSKTPQDGQTLASVFPTLVLQKNNEKHFCGENYIPGSGPSSKYFALRGLRTYQRGADNTQEVWTPTPISSANTKCTGLHGRIGACLNEPAFASTKVGWRYRGCSQYSSPLRVLRETGDKTLADKQSSTGTGRKTNARGVQTALLEQFCHTGKPWLRDSRAHKLGERQTPVVYRLHFFLNSCLHQSYHLMTALASTKIKGAVRTSRETFNARFSTQGCQPSILAV